MTKPSDTTSPRAPLTMSRTVGSMISLTTLREKKLAGRADQLVLDRRQRLGAEQRRDVGQAAQHSQQQGWQGQRTPERRLCRLREDRVVPALRQRALRDVPNVVAGRLRRRLVIHDQSSIPDGRSAQSAGAVRRRIRRADLEHGGQLDQLGFVLVGVMLAEQQFGARRQASPVRERRRRSGRSDQPWSVRDWSELRSWPPPYASRVHLLSQTFWFRPCSPGVYGCVVSHACVELRAEQAGGMSPSPQRLVHLCSDDEWRSRAGPAASTGRRRWTRRLRPSVDP